MKHLEIEFRFGLGFEWKGTPLTPELITVGLRQIRDCAIEAFGGCTLTRAEGDWLDIGTDKIVSEEVATLSVLVELPIVPGVEMPPRERARVESNIGSMVNAIKTLLNQAAVYVTRYQVDSRLH